MWPHPPSRSQSQLYLCEIKFHTGTYINIHTYKNQSSVLPDNIYNLYLLLISTAEWFKRQGHWVHWHDCEALARSGVRALQPLHVTKDKTLTHILCNLNHSWRGSMQLQLLLHPSDLPSGATMYKREHTPLSKWKCGTRGKSLCWEDTLQALTALLWGLRWVCKSHKRTLSSCMRLGKYLMILGDQR